MLALTLQNGELSLQNEYPMPNPAPGQALLRMRMAGICGTDMALLHGYKGGFSGVLGHEYVAEIVAAPGQEQGVGRRVVGEINTTCGQCARCRAGLDTHCLRRQILGISQWDGVFAEYFLSPTLLLHPIPDDLPDEIAVFAEPVAAAYAVLRDLPAAAGERVIVFGDGRLGQIIALVLQAEGYDPLLVGRHSHKLAVAAQAGVRVALHRPAGVEFDIAVDASGRPEAFADILTCLRPRGVLVLKSTSAHPALLDLSPIVVNEIRVIGSRCGPFLTAIQALHSGKVDPRPLISARYPLAQALEAFEQASQKSAIKVLLTP